MGSAFSKTRDSKFFPSDKMLKTFPIFLAVCKIPGSQNTLSFKSVDRNNAFQKLFQNHNCTGKEHFRNLFLSGNKL